MDEPFAPYLGQTFGNYSLIKLLGMGGFSEVYLGMHVHLETQAAVKILRTRLNEDEFERFRQEAQTIIGLGHPHLVRILDFGIRDGIPFLVMNYAPNGSLRDLYPAGSRLPLQTVVELVKQIASVLQYAHDHQIVHRDIKPDNLLLGANNEVLLSDFGIAVAAHNTYSMKTQEAIGTVAYMAPEQLRRKARPASDQYALGIVVYEWITGEPPFEGEPIQVALQHLTELPPPLHTKRADISAGVEDVVLKALSKEPQDRFSSVQAFSEALEQACQAAKAGEHRPGLAPQDEKLRILQERPSTPEKPARRTLLKAGLIAGAVAAAGVGTWQLTRALSPTPAWNPLQSFNTHMKPTQMPELNQTQQPNLPSKMDAAVTGIAWSPGGRLFAVTDGSGNVGVWDTDQQQIWHRNVGVKIWSLGWSPDGIGPQRLAIAGDDGTVSILDALNGKRLLVYTGHVPDKTLSVAWPLPVTYSPFTNLYTIPNLVASGDINGNIHVWNPDTGQVQRKMVQAAPVTALAFGNAFVASVGAPPGGSYSIWNLVADQYHPDGHYINSIDHFINTSPVQGISPDPSVTAATLTAVSWSRDMQFLCIGDADGHLLVSSLGGLPWAWPCYFSGAKGQINAIRWSINSYKWVTASEDGAVQIWNLPKVMNYQAKIDLAPEETYRPGGHIRALAWSPDEKYLLAGNETGSLYFLHTS